MEQVSWKTAFSGELTFVFSSGKKTKVSNPNAQLCVFAMSAIRTIKDEFLTGAEVMRSWKIKSFSPEERILEIEKIKA